MSEQTQAFETRVSPDGADLVQRWQAEDGSWGSWVLVGGTDDGDQMGDAEVEDWTPLVPEPELLTEALFDAMAPVVGTAIGIMAVADALNTLDEMVGEVDFDNGWGSLIRDRAVDDLRGMVAEVRKTLARIEARLPTAVDTAGADEEQG